MSILKITIEGPPASGKTKIARLIANASHYEYIIIHDDDGVTKIEYGNRNSDSRIEIYCKRTTESL